MPGLQIVADRLSRGTAELGKGADMRGDPLRQLLAPHRLGVGEAGGAQRGDKDLHRNAISPLLASTASPVRPAKSTNMRSPATWT